MAAAGQVWLPLVYHVLVTGRRTLAVHFGLPLRLVWSASAPPAPAPGMALVVCDREHHNGVRLG